MTRLPSLTAAKVVRALERGGFRQAHQRGSHLFLYHSGRNLLLTVPIHPGDLPRGLMKKIIKQAGLTEDEFRALF